MVKLIQETEFPSGSVVQLWEVEGQEFRFEFPVEITEVVFPSGYKQFVVEKVGQE